MTTYKVRITETLEKEVEIEAENKIDALNKAQINYAKAETDYILNENDYKGCDIEVIE